MPIPTAPGIPGAPMLDPAAALEEGLAAATGTGKGVSREEIASVRKWWGLYDQARKFDAIPRQQFAIDRRYARGDSGFLVDANLIGTNIDILESHLYARNPDFQITPGKAMRPPSVESLRDAVESQMEADGSLAAAGAMAGQQALQLGLDPMQAKAAADQAQAMLVEGKVMQEVHKLRQRYARRERDIKAFCESCEIIGSRLWEEAALKARGVPQVRSNLTVGLGVLKASWQERTEVSPTHQTAINDLLGNLESLEALKAQQASDDGTWQGTANVAPGTANQDVPQDATAPFSGDINSYEARAEAIRQQIKALQANAERVVERGFVIDNVQAENFQVPPGFTIANHKDAPWNADADYPTVEQALADHGAHLKSLGLDPVALMNKAQKYAPRKPGGVLAISASTIETAGRLQLPEAEEFVGPGASGYADTGDANHVRRVEIWDRTANCVRTLIEGIEVWVKPVWNPPPTKRFYPYFVLTDAEVDGARWPQSRVTRSIKLVDEYNRIGSDEAKHRRRIIPKMAFDAGNVPEQEARKLEQADIGEMVGLKLTQAGSRLDDSMKPVQYPPMDAAVYDRQRIVTELDRIWGIQEAQAGAVNMEKTATEAEIQQAGFQARTGSQRDRLDSCYSDLAQYTIEIARQYVTIEDAVEICGEDVFWPAYGGPEDLVYTVAITVRAGSSGKPNTSRERESWATLLPILQSGIVQIGQLRGASPDQMADALEEVIKLTAERSGERINIEGLIPRGGGMGLMPGGVPTAAGGAPGAPVDEGGADPNLPPGALPGDADPLAAEHQPTTYV